MKSFILIAFGICVSIINVFAVTYNQDFESAGENDFTYSKHVNASGIDQSLDVVPLDIRTGIICPLNNAFWIETQDFSSPFGVPTFGLIYAYADNDPLVTLSLKYSTDGGNTWVNMNGVSLNNPSTTEWKNFSSNNCVTGAQIRFKAEFNTTYVGNFYLDHMWVVTSETAPYVAPTVSALSAQSITSTTAYIRGEVTATGGQNPSSRKLFWQGGSEIYNAGSGSTGEYGTTVSSLSPNSYYVYYATATNDGGTGSSSNQGFYTLPATPSANSASAVTSNGYRANWSSVSCNSYTIYFDLNDDGIFESNYNTTNTYYDISGIGINQRTRYYVVANGNGGSSGGSNTIYPYTLAISPNAPVCATASQSSITVNPDKGSNPSTTQLAIRIAGQYVQYPGGTVSGSASWTTDANWGTITVTGLTPNTLYTVDVLARNGDAVNTSFSSSSTARTRSAEPTTHSNAFTVANYGPYRQDLSYQAGSALSNWFGYILLRTEGSTAPNNTNINDGSAPNNLTLPVGTTLVAVVTDNSMILSNSTGLSEQTEYSYAVIPFNYNGTEEVTYNYKTDGVIPTDSETTPAAFPATQASNMVFSNVTRTGMTVKWTRGDGHKSLLLGRQQYRINSNTLTDNTIYSANSNYSAGSFVNESKVLFSGSSANPSAEITGLERYKLVYFKAVEFNEFNEDNLYYLETENSTNPRSRWTLRRDALMEEDLSIDAEYPYPNPVSNSITTTLDVFEEGRVTAVLYNLEGKMVFELYNQTLPFGSHELTFDLTNTPSGIYQIVISKGSEAVVYPISVVR